MANNNPPSEQKARAYGPDDNRDEQRSAPSGQHSPRRDDRHNQELKHEELKHEKQNGGGNGGKIAIGIGVLLVILLIFFGIIPRVRQSRALADEAKQKKNALPQVVFVHPHPSPDSDLILPGNTSAITDAVIAARTSGYVRRRYVDIGTHVKQGQLLAEIEAPDVEAQVQQANQQTSQARAGVQQSESDVTNREATVAQSRAAVRQAEANLETSRAQLADADAKLSQAESQLATTQAQLSQAQQTVDIKRATLNQAQTQLDLAAVTLKRYETLLKAGYVALQDVDQSQATYDNARAAVRSAQADLRGAEDNVRAAETQVTSARSNVKSFQAEVTAAQKTVKAVAATVGASQSAVLAAQANVRSARATVQANQANVRAAQANARRFGVQSGFSKVVAPFDGVITARNVDIGSLISAGGGSSGGSTDTGTGGSSVTGSASTATSNPSTTPGGGLFGLARTDTLRVLVGVPQTYASLIRAGQMAQLTLREFPGRTFNGQVHNVSGAIDAVSRTLLVEIYVPNRDATLFPGMYTQVRFDLPKTRGSLRLPSNTLLFDAQGTRVATVTPQNTIHFVPVRVGRDFGTEIEIVEGLQGKESVITNPNDTLAENAHVDAKEQKPPDQTGKPGQPEKPGQNGQNGSQGKPNEH